MVVTLWIVLFILGVMWVTYPDDFPTMVRNPQLLIEGIAVESKRRWMILKFGSILWIERQRLRYSLWRMRDIIASELKKQQTTEETND